jgi:hypothetical protein
MPFISSDPHAWMRTYYEVVASRAGFSHVAPSHQAPDAVGKRLRLKHDLKLVSAWAPAIAPGSNEPGPEQNDRCGFRNGCSTREVVLDLLDDPYPFCARLPNEPKARRPTRPSNGDPLIRKGADEDAGKPDAKRRRHRDGHRLKRRKRDRPSQPQQRTGAIAAKVGVGHAVERGHAVWKPSEGEVCA